MDTWTDFFRSFFQTLSPKVVVPFLIVQLGNLIYAIGSGGWDWHQTLIALLGLVASAFGFSVPPAPDVRHHEVAALSRRKR